jgi:hypothetical protein
MGAYPALKRWAISCRLAARDSVVGGPNVPASCCTYARRGMRRWVLRAGSKTLFSPGERRLKVGQEVTARATFDGKKYQATNIRVENGKDQEGQDPKAQ